LIIDYGDAHSFGDSLRAFKQHKIVDIFETPGMSDMTANVDFAYIREAMEGAATVHGPLSQAAFLHNMGLDIRLSKLSKQHRKDSEKKKLSLAAMRLVAVQGMGTQYKVLGATSTGGRALRSEEKEVWPFVENLLRERWNTKDMLDK